VTPIQFPQLTRLSAGAGITTAGSSAHHQPGGFAAQLLQALASTQAQAAHATVQFAQGHASPGLATVVTQAVQADLMAQEFALLASKALSAYQSVMNMQV
jgi:flagellar hook-basal body complex protein FliE